MGGTDKGLIALHGKPLIDHIITALAPQVGAIIINANRNLERYGEFGLPVVTDMLGEFFGPLAGMASGMQASDKTYILTVPCDSPFIPDTMADTLFRALMEAQADISVAHDGVRLQPVFALLRRELLPDLLAYLEAGGRKIDTWYEQQRMTTADFSAWPDTFLNLNTPEDKQILERKRQETS